MSWSSIGLMSGIGKLARIFDSMPGSLFTSSWIIEMSCDWERPLRILGSGVLWFCCAMGDSVMRNRFICGVWGNGVPVCVMVRPLRGDWLVCGDIITLDEATPSKCSRLRGELRRVIDVVDFVGVRSIESSAAVDDGILSGDQLIERRRPLCRIITKHALKAKTQLLNSVGNLNGFGNSVEYAYVHPAMVMGSNSQSGCCLVDYRWPCDWAERAPHRWKRAIGSCGQGSQPMLYDDGLLG